MENNVLSFEQIPKHWDFYDDGHDDDSSNYNLSAWWVPFPVLCVLHGSS